MATDSTQLTPSETSVETESDMSMNGQEFGSVQLAAATDAPVSVDIPSGQQVVVIPVKPGQTIELPTDSPDGLLAKLGADGNLAIVVDGRTIILQGYAEANAEAPIKIVTDDGDTIDVNEVIVATNPDVALDIQTAAGPAAAGAQGDTDPNGSGIYDPFGPAAPLGGLHAVGVLDPTQLQYRLIDQKVEEFPTDEGEPPHNPPTIDFHPENPNVKDGRTVVSDEGLPGGNPDSDPSPADETNNVVTTGTFVVSDPDAGDTLTVTLQTTGLPALKFGGETVSWSLSPDGHTLTGKTGGTAAIVIEISTADGHNYDYKVTLLKPLDHSLTDDPSTKAVETSFEDQISFNVGVKVTDSTGLSDTAHLTIEIEDDSPTVTVELGERGEGSGTLHVDLDETVGTDRYAPGEFNDGGPNDDVPGALAQATTNVFGGLKALFSVGGGFGADGPGTLTESLSFTGIPAGGLATNLSATDGGQITLFLNGSNLIEGKDTNGDVVFTIEIVDLGGGNFQLQTTLFEALDHPNNDLLDETLTLQVLQGTVDLEYTVSRTDADGDKVTNSATIELANNDGSYFRFDDDGPTLTVGQSEQGTSGLDVELDETEGTDRAAPGETADGNTDDAGPGLGQVVTNVPGGLKALFSVGGDFGSDGPGSDTDSLSFVGIPVGGLPTNLEATDGGAISLFLNGSNVIEGKDTNGDVVFTIEIVDVGGGNFQLQTTLFEALKHGDNSTFDETIDLLVTQGGVQLQYEVTRTDGDGDPVTESATVDLIGNEGSYFHFDDDGPTLTVGQSEQGTGGLAVELDETEWEGGDRAAPGETADGNTDDAGPGLGQVVTNVPGGLKALFSVGTDFGSDGPGSVTDSLSFTGIPVGGLPTTLEATDGGAITLFLNGSTTIEGKDTNGDVVFTIEIVDLGGGNFQLETTLFEALKHPDNSLFDESVQLLLEDGAVQLKYEVTATDGDGDPVTDSATIDLITDESSYFTFDDDGPTQTVSVGGEVSGSLVVELDETVGPDRYAPGEASDGGPNDDVPGALAQATTNILGGLKALFSASGDYGSDGAGSVTDSLGFTGIPVGGLPTNLEATDGGAITLFLNGSTEIQGKDGDGDIVFTIKIVDAGGGVYQLETTLFEALKHGDNTKFDETVDLLVADGAVQLEYTVTRTDGDGDQATDSATIDLITGESTYFHFDDDGPSLDVTVDLEAASALKTELDETVGSDHYAPGEASDGGPNDDVPGALAQSTTDVTGGLKGLFSAGGLFGSDGQGGAVTDSLSFTGIPVGGLPTSLEATDGGAITLFLNGSQEIQGKDGDGDIVFTIKIVDVGGGELQLETTLFEALKHGDTGKFDETVDLLVTEGLVQLKYEATGTDGDGDPVSGSATIDLISDEDSYFSFDDDGPTAAIELKEGATLVVDETVGGSPNDNDETNSADPNDIGYGKILGTALFTDSSVFGSDGPSSSTDKSFALSVNGGDGTPSGLVDTQSGEAVLLYNNGGVIEGRTAIGGELVFTISTDANSGDVEVHQYRAVVHDDPNDPDQSSSPAAIDPDLIQLTVTVTDGDGDQDTASVDVGSVIKFEDDGPTAAIELKEGATLVVDETVGGSPNDNDETASADSKDIGYGKILGTALFTDNSVFGSDGPNASTDKSFALSVNGGDGTPSGLVDTQSGEAILLYNNGGVIEGRTASGNELVFTVSTNVDSGDVEVHQYRAVVHDDPNDPDQSSSPAAIDPDLIQLTVTVTDGDGDHDTASVDVGSAIKFEDDGPTVGQATSATINLTVDETVGGSGDIDANGTNGTSQDGSRAENDETLVSLPGSLTGLGTVIGAATADASGLFTVNFGSDGKASSGEEAYSLKITDANTGLIDTASGQNIVLFDMGNGVIVGRTETGHDVVFALTVDGDGNISMAQYRAINHGTDGKDSYPDEVIPLGGGKLAVELTATDGDGDTDTAQVDIGGSIKFEDDGPTVTVGTGTFSLAVDETVGGSGDVDANGTNGTAQDGSAVENDEVVNLAAVTAAGLSTTGLIGANTASTAGFFTTSAGSDGQASKTYSLDITGGGNTGLTDTATGQAITLVDAGGGVIEGRNTNGDVVFALTVDSSTGVVTMAQYRAVDHGSDGATSYPDEVASMLPGKLAVTVTVVDKDGDVATASKDISGGITFDDDGPNAVDDVKSAGTSGSVTGNVLTDGATDDTFGSDGKGSPAITKVVFKGTTYTDASDGTVDGLIHVKGDLGDLELNTATGDYKYTRTSSINDTGEDVFTYTIQDKDGDTDDANLKVTVDAANILNGVFITNTNSTDQPLVLTFQDMSNPLHFSSKVYSLNAQGQQGTVAQDVGFFIDPTKNHLYSVEAGETKSFTNIIVTDFSLEGTDLNAPGGSDNWQLRYDDNQGNGGGSRDLAYSGVFQPSTKTEVETDQPSVDGDSKGNSLTDPNAGGKSGVDFQFGAGGADTLTGSDDTDILNGGNGIDQVNGKGGNDILVYDAEDVSTVVGKDAGFIDGGTGIDVLRIDDGALDIFFNGTKNPVVDLRGADIRNIEIIGITEEAVSKVDNGTTLKLNAADVVNFSGDALGADTLYIVGNKGDKLQISNADAGNWTDGDGIAANGVTKVGTVDNGDGQVFDHYVTKAGGHLYVDADIKVETV